MCWKNRRKKNKTFVWLILSTSFRLSSVGCWSCISIWIIYIRHTSLILSWWNVYCCDILLLWNKDRSPSFHFSYIFIFCCRCCYALMCLFRCCRPRVVYSLSRNRSENNPSSFSTTRTHNQHDKSKLEAITSIGAANWNPYRVECVGEKYETRKKKKSACIWLGWQFVESDFNENAKQMEIGEKTTRTTHTQKVHALRYLCECYWVFHYFGCLIMSTMLSMPWIFITKAFFAVSLCYCVA